MRESIRTWGPVVAWVVALPVAFVVLRWLLPPIGARAPAPPPPPAEAVAPAPPPVGDSSTCAGCHPEQSAAWAASTHASAERALGEGDPRELRLVGPDGAEASFPVTRAIGVEPLVQYLVEVPGTGRLQVSQLARRTSDGGWFDVFADERRPGEWGHWTGGGMTWNSRCGECHTTGFRKGFVQAGTYRSTFTELGVGCASCHGAAPHPGGAPLVTPDLDTCASCHARRATLTEDFRPGDRFLDHFAPALVDPSPTFRPDGGVADEDFEYTAFLGSKMHGKGVTCTSCHDPHSGRTRQEGDALCLSCHAAMPQFDPAHAHHGPEQASCTSCHMPVTTYMQVDPRHDHVFSIPSPALTEQTGLPNACQACHPSGIDLPAAAARWWSRPVPPRVDALVRARAGGDDAVPGLLATLQDEAPAWRAAAALHLQPWLDRPEVRAALAPLLADVDPLVRFAAADALGPAAPAPDVEPALRPLLRDPVRAVRVSAGRALRFRYGQGAVDVADYSAYLALHADDPTALLERGTWAMELGHPGSARMDLEAALGLDPRSVAAMDALAVLAAQTGRPADAVQLLTGAVALAPDDAELRFRLGLAQAGVGDDAAARGTLREVVRLDPRSARAWYNLGLLEAREGGTAGVSSLRQAVALSPDDPEVGYALALTLSTTDPRGAAAEARRVLSVAPGHDGATALLRRLVP